MNIMERVSLNINEVGNKAMSMWEIYKLLIVKGHFFLPPYKL